MRKLLGVLTLLFSGVVLSQILALPLYADLLKEPVVKESSESALKDDGFITVDVKGVTCSYCASGIKKSLLKNLSVKSVEVDMESSIVTIALNKSAVLSKKIITNEEITKAVADNGASVVSIR